MTDPTDAPLSETAARASFDSANAPASADTIAAFTATMKAAGHGDEQIAAAIAKAGVKYGGDSSPGRLHPATGHDAVLQAYDPSTALSPSETAAAVTTLRRAWTGDPAILEAAIGKVGGNADPAERTAFERSFDEHLRAPDDLRAYDIRSALAERIEGVDTADAVQVDGAARQLLRELDAPVSVGGVIIDALLSGAEAYAEAMEGGEASLKLWQNTQKVELANHSKELGGEAMARHYAIYALRNVNHADQQEMVDTGAIQDHRFILQLALQGQRAFERAEAAERRMAHK